MTDENNEGNPQATPQLDDRRDLPIFIHSELDDFGLSSRAFRVYAHLARRAGRNGAFPSYTSIGRVCFTPDLPDAKPDTLKQLAIQAVKELVSAGLVYKQVRTLSDGGNTSNLYSLTPRSKWVVKVTGGNGGLPGGGNGELPQGNNVPKGTPIESTPIESNPLGEENRLPNRRKATKAAEPQSPTPSWQRQPSRKESVFLHLNARCPAAQRRPIVDALIAVHGLQAIIDADHPDADRTLNGMHELACVLHEMKMGVKDIERFFKLWQEKDFRGQKKQRPQNGQFLTFISQQLADTSDFPAEDPGERTTVTITDSWDA